jgi:hypothetical protein
LRPSPATSDQAVGGGARFIRHALASQHAGNLFTP